jgi:hypothetical protein
MTASKISTGELETTEWLQATRHTSARGRMRPRGPRPLRVKLSVCETTGFGKAPNEWRRVIVTVPAGWVE